MFISFTPQNCDFFFDNRILFFAQTNINTHTHIIKWGWIWIDIKKMLRILHRTSLFSINKLYRIWNREMDISLYQ